MLGAANEDLTLKIRTELIDNVWFVVISVIQNNDVTGNGTELGLGISGQKIIFRNIVGGVRYQWYTVYGNA